MAIAYMNPATLKIDHAFVTAGSNAELRAKVEEREGQLRSAGMVIKGSGKIGRNRTCPCGSGFKFKKCCLSRAT